jgi:hypothetical protein
MKKLLTLTLMFLVGSALVFSGCDVVKGLFGGKGQNQAPQMGPSQPGQPPMAAPPGGAPQSQDMNMASVNGKYSNLLMTLYVPQDQASYGSFYDWGYYTGTSYAGYNNIPPGYWVYVYPNWYVWGNTR